MISWFLIIILLIFGLVSFRGAPYIPTHKKAIIKALDMLPLKKGDTIVDLGSGDGAFIIAASRRGYRAIGYEINPILNFICRVRCKILNVNAKCYTRDYWRVALPKDTKAVFVFLAGPYMQKLKDKLMAEAKNKKALYVISYGFEIPGLNPVKNEDGLYLYEVINN